MTVPAVAALGLAGVIAAADWWAVGTGRKRLEYVFKPATMLALIACALLLHPVAAGERAWFVLALCLGAAGDVLLMLPTDRFVAGLGAFLLGHLAFASGFVAGGQSAGRVAAVAVVLAILAALLLPPVVRGARRQGQSRVVPALLAYLLVIGVMVATAFGSRQPLAVVPAMLFFGSDSLIALRRFVSPRPWMSLAVIVSYHLAQAGLVLWLTL
ncbi:MAG: hypothetical protein QOK05_2517 [Chloroflexota bacterium]|jgi:uncharacterized membrane protein YhhN|nr:hypothetical protein [Chloroflexota bacterium]